MFLANARCMQQFLVAVVVMHEKSDVHCDEQDEVWLVSTVQLYPPLADIQKSHKSGIILEVTIL